MRPQMLVLRGGGASAPALDTQVMTIGSSGSVSGFVSSPAIGSMIDGTSNIYGGAAIVRLSYDSTSGFGIRLGIAGASLANSGWETLDIVGLIALPRSSAAYSTNGFNTFWTWGNSLPASGTYTVRFS